MSDATPSAALAWKHGVVSVSAQGAMLGPTSFILEDGWQVSPFYIAPWFDEPDVGRHGAYLAGLRGEWPCVPFGRAPPENGFAPDWLPFVRDVSDSRYGHGYGSHAVWTIREVRDDTLSLFVDYPETEAVGRLERIIHPDPDAPALDFELTIHARRKTREPIALHACFQLPNKAGTVELIPGTFRSGRTHPGTFADIARLFRPDAEFYTLNQVPGSDGRLVDATHIPFAVNVEEIAQLNGTDGRFELVNGTNDYKLQFTWDSRLLPSVLLWYSNRGRGATPWNNRNLCLGIEPACSAFGLAPETSRLDNSIAHSGTPTVLALDPDKPTVIHYRIEVSKMSARSPA